MTVITLTPEIEQGVTERAKELGTTPERLVLDKLREEFAPVDYRDSLPPPRDDWERDLRSIGTPCGVSLTDEQVSREALYEDHF